MKNKLIFILAMLSINLIALILDDSTGLKSFPYVFGFWSYPLLKDL